MRAAKRNERFESILLAYVRALGPELVLPPDLLARIREQVPDATREEVDAAIRWSLRESRRKDRAADKREATSRRWGGR